MVGCPHKALYDLKGRLLRISQYIHSRTAQTRLLSKKFCIWQPCNAHMTSAQDAAQSRNAWSQPRWYQSSSGRGSDCRSFWRHLSPEVAPGSQCYPSSFVTSLTHAIVSQVYWDYLSQWWRMASSIARVLSSLLDGPGCYTMSGHRHVVPASPYRVTAMLYRHAPYA